MELTDERKEVELGNGLTVVVKWYLDENPGLSHLGEYTSSDGDIIIDRHTGELLGDDIPEPESPHDLPLTSWNTMRGKEIYRLREQAWAEWEKNGGRKVLARWLSTADRPSHEYRYFDPTHNHLPHNPKNWAHVENIDKHHADAKAKLAEFEIDTGNKALDLDVLYACQDYQRMEDYNRSGWSMWGCVAVVLLNDQQIARSYGVWGIESDSDEEHKREVEQEQVREALDQVKTLQAELASIDIQRVFAELE